MIGLGSNRLTCCRRGGMSVTQAGRGGMEWLAGFRAPSWASPYSDQATAAIKQAYPNDYQVILAYGFRHPELVPLFNLYPVGCSTFYVVGGYQEVQYLKATGSQYLKIPFTYTGGIKKIVCDYVPDAISVIFSEWLNTSVGGGVCYEQDNSSQIRAWIGNKTSDWLYFNANQSRHTVKFEDNKWYLDNVLQVEKTQGSLTGVSPNIHLFARGVGGNLNAASKCTIYTNFEMQADEYGILLKACYNKTSGVIGMFDLVNNTFHTNAGSGTFTKGADIAS